MKEMTTEDIHEMWRCNGWNGDLKETGRELTKSCGHKYWVGYGISDEEFKNHQRCFDCLELGKVD